MKLILFHPRLLERTCQRCQSWLYDEHDQMVCQLGQPVRRPAEALLPCWQCPKQSPATAAGCERDIERIAARVRLYFEVQATAGHCLSVRQAADRLLVRQLAMVDAVVRRAGGLLPRDAARQRR